MKKNKSTKAWLHRHLHDCYVSQANLHGFRSRAAYKLLQLDQQYQIFAATKLIIDLGCAPGSWSQVALKKTTAKIIGVDLLAITSLVGINFIQGDFNDELTVNKILTQADNQAIDLILSDMAPNISGIKIVDQAKAANLVELTLNFAANYLSIKGKCVIKIFQGTEFNQLIKLSKLIFKRVVVCKPKASRDESNENYIICSDKYELKENLI